MKNKLPTNFGADVIAIHVVTLNNRTKFYNDKVDANGNHTTCPREVQGEVGKIYIDQLPLKNFRTINTTRRLKIIDDINSKRVHRPEEIYNAMK